MIWDKILKTKEESRLLLTEERIKYHLADYAKHLRNTKVNLSLNYDVQPLSGFLQMVNAFSGEPIQMPSHYL